MRAHLIAAARKRADLADDESGFMLIYVMMITTLVTILVTSTLVVTGSSVVPAVRSTYNQAAESAARGGIQAFLSYINTHCGGTSASTTACTLPSNYGSQQIPTGTGTYSARYAWTASKGTSWFRVASRGTVTQGGLTVSKTIVADVAGGASSDTLDFGIVTGFETEASDVVLSRFPARAIALNAAAIAAAGVPIKNGKIEWSGASPGTAAGKVAVCNAIYTGTKGRAQTPPPNAPNPYVDWSENGLKGNNYTDYQPCQVSFGHYTKLLAPENPADGIGGYFSKDALLLSNSWPGGTGPLFNQPVTTQYRYSSGDGPCGSPGAVYRSLNLLCAGYAVEVGGSPAPTSEYGVSWVQYGPRIPSNNVNIPAAACLYTGPTRIKLNGDGTATVTSPQTTSTWIAAHAASSPAQCYVGAGGTGLGAATISFTSPQQIFSVAVLNNGNVPPTTPALAHGSSGWPVTGQKLGATAGTTNSIFYLTSGSAGTSSTVAYNVNADDGSYTPAYGDNPSQHTDQVWQPQWTSYTNVACNTLTNPADLRFASCYWPIGTNANGYSWLKHTVEHTVQANPENYTTAAALQTLVSSLVSQGNTADAGQSGPSTSSAVTSHRWQVSVTQGNAGTCTQSTGVVSGSTSTPIPSPTSDAMFANTNGSINASTSTDTSCFTVTVKAQVPTCPLVLGCLLTGWVWGDGGLLSLGGTSVPQASAVIRARTATTTTTTTPAISSFPSMADVTQYSMGKDGTFGASGPGDLYVEGTSTGSMALIAQNDVIFTGSLAPISPTTQALEIIAQDNGRIYHPVKCLSTDPAAIAATDPGFCPNDITGLYTGVPPDGSRPYQQYVNLRQDLANMTLRGAIFSLGNAPASITCPQPPQGGGVCGGEFSTDNYNRGAEMGELKVIGSLAMAHHGPLGQEWDIPDATGQSSRPYSGYQYVNQYQNLKNAIIQLNHDMAIPVLTTTTSTAAMWHIVSYSAATS